MRTEPEESFEAEMAKVIQGMERLAVNAHNGSLAFAAGEEISPEAGDLVELVLPQANVGHSGESRGRWSEARAEFDAFVVRLNEDVCHATVLRSGVGEGGIRTWVAWNGDTVTVIHPGHAALHAEAHAERLSRQLLGRILRLRMLAATATAAARIAMLTSIPGGGILALPVAFRYIRSMSTHWNDLLAA